MDLQACKEVCKFHFGHESVKNDLGQFSFELNPWTIEPMTEFVVITENHGANGTFFYTLLGDDDRVYSMQFYSSNELSILLADLLRELRC